MSAPVSARKSGLFFIVGNHRGGTTLLQSMLASHSRIAIPPETQYFLEVWPRRERLGDLSDPVARSRVADYLQSEECAVRDLKLDPADLLARLDEGLTDYAELFVALLEIWAAPLGKPRVGEKSPGHIHAVALLAELFPEARFITALRDPRAVVSSELAAEWGARSVDQIARRWSRVVDRHLELSRALPEERYRMVRYEDLVADPEPRLRELCAFLGEDFEPDMLDYHRRPERELGFDPSERWKYNTLKPLDPSRVNAWRQDLSSTQVAIVEAVTGPRLEALGYAAAGTDQPGALRFAVARLLDRLPWALEVATGAARRKRGPRRRRA